MSGLFMQKFGNRNTLNDTYCSPVASRCEPVLSTSGDVSEVTVDGGEVVETIQNHQTRRSRDFHLKIFAI